jgi:hypothetical protein
VGAYLARLTANLLPLLILNFERCIYSVIRPDVPGGRCVIGGEDRSAESGTIVQTVVLYSQFSTITKRFSFGFATKLALPAASRTRMFALFNAGEVRLT